MTRFGEPSELNGYLSTHVTRLLDSFRHWTGRNLVAADQTATDRARELFHASFVVLSHDTAPDPILNYANLAGLRLFGLSWDEMITLPSRLTAEPVHQDERERLLATVTRQGYIDDYRGVRISNGGRRFLIEQAIVWNLLDGAGAPFGQAATFGQWRYLD